MFVYSVGKVLRIMRCCLKWTNVTNITLHSGHSIVAYILASGLRTIPLKGSQNETNLYTKRQSY